MVVAMGLCCDPVRLPSLHRRWLSLVLAWLASGFAISPSRTGAAAPWTTGYYAGWTQSDMPPSAIDFSALTHVIHFSVLPKAGGAIDSARFGLTPTASSSLISKAHAAGTKVLLCVGGAGTQADFQAATTPTALPKFIKALVSFVDTRGYDGLDLDWEPLDPGDHPAFEELVHGVRAGLNALSRPQLLTAAIASEPSLMTGLHPEFDQINVMTYDMAGPWDGWVTWFNAPIFDGGYRFPSTGALIPSGNGLVNRFLAAGVPAAKLGMGLAFYGAVWSGGAGFTTGGPSLPRQSWSTAPTVTALNYTEILSTYYTADRYHWDTNAQSAYLSINNAGAAEDRFVSYDDEHACQAKVSYARNRSMGGVMIWELAGAYFPARPAGQRHPLLSAVKEAFQPPRFSQIERAGNNVLLTFASIPLAQYRVDRRDALTSGTWTAVTNITGTGQPLQVKDSASSPSSARYYRIQSPP